MTAEGSVRGVAEVGGMIYFFYVPNSTGVKVIRARDGQYPYVSAQAFRYWLRTTLEQTQPAWRSAPVYREEKIAYTDANPIKWWDGDLFGYIRAPSKRESARAKTWRTKYSIAFMFFPLSLPDG